MKRRRGAGYVSDSSIAGTTRFYAALVRLVCLAALAELCNDRCLNVPGHAKPGGKPGPVSNSVRKRLPAVPILVLGKLLSLPESDFFSFLLDSFVRARGFTAEGRMNLDQRMRRGTSFALPLLPDMSPVYVMLMTPLVCSSSQDFGCPATWHL